MALLVVGCILLVACIAVSMRAYLERQSVGESGAPLLFLAALVLIYNGINVHQAELKAEKLENCQTAVAPK